MILKKLYIMPFAAVMMFACPANAVPTISSPYVSKGEMEIEAKFGVDMDGGEDDAWESEVSTAYGITDFWQTEIGVEGGDPGDDEDAGFSALAFENKFQLAPRGQFWADPGLKIEYEKNLEDGPDEITADLLLAKQTGMFNHGAEIGIAREVGEDSQDGLNYNLAYGVSYNWREDMQFGVEWYSDFGDFEEDFDDQGHSVGPVMYGEITEGLEYQTGVLFGLSDAAPDATLKAVAGFEF